MKYHIDQNVYWVIQAAMQKTLHYTAPLDGIWGPLSKAAFQAYRGYVPSQSDLVRVAQRHLKIAVDGICGNVTRSAAKKYRQARQNPGLKGVSPKKSSVVNNILNVLNQELSKGVRETSRNRGPELGKYWDATHYDQGDENREPWCAAFVCYVLKEALKCKTYSFKRPTSPSCFKAEISLESQLRAACLSGQVKEVKPSEAIAGDVFIMNISHTGFVVGRTPDGLLITIEGNTNAAGSREGDGLYKKSRTVAGIRSCFRIVL